MKDTNTEQLVLEQFLKDSLFDGWSLNTLSKTCEKLNLPPEYGEILFPDGLHELGQEFSKIIDNDMEKKIDLDYLKNLRVRDKIIYIVRARINAYIPYRGAVRSLMRSSTYPTNMLNASKMLWSTSDHIWQLAGDNSTDYNYYTKRMLLSCVFKVTMIYWLADESDDYNNTWEFLERRIDNVLKIGSVKKAFKDIFEKTKNIPFLRLLTRNKLS